MSKALAKHNTISSIEQLAEQVDYSLLDSLNCDPCASNTGDEHRARQVFSGHYVPVKPTPIAEPEYVAHSSTFFAELGLADALAKDPGFIRLFSGDLSQLPDSMNAYGWATGYALSIYGTEYIQQCPFRTGNGYGDGRAISAVEAVLNGQRWEMQLKGAGPTPYCRGADGRAVLRSSVREFLAQEHMHALGVPTSRSLSLYVSKSETVDRPWYFEGSQSMDPEIMVSNPVAISTRVAPSFLRVGQLELFGRRARHNEHPEALKELELIVQHLIEREYKDEIDPKAKLSEQVVTLASLFRNRLIELVTKWIQVGYCQGNFNSDNCAAGGYTLDYGPFGFCEMFDPVFQPWTGGGRHFSFLNQPAAAEKNFGSFCSALKPLLQSEPAQLEALEIIEEDFGHHVEKRLQQMWADKLGLAEFDSEFFMQLLKLMVQSSVDYNLFFRELSEVPASFSQLSRCFYQLPTQEQETQWQQWLSEWRERVKADTNGDKLSQQLKRVNPKYTWREWLIVPAYKAAAEGDYSLIAELQGVLSRPFDEQSKDIEDKYYQLRPKDLFGVGGVSHYSCSS